MNISRLQWGLALASAATAHALLLAAFFFGGFDRREPVDTPEGVMVSLDNLDAGPPPEASPAEAPVDALVPQAESASAPPAAEAGSVDTTGAAAQVPEPAASIGPEPADSAAALAEPSAAAAAPESVENVPAVSPEPAPANAVAVAPIDASDTVEPQESVTAETPDIAQTQTREVDETANGAFGNSEEATDDYIVRLRAWLSRHKQYPQAARQSESEGTVRLYIVVDQSGNVLTSRVSQSSGSALLDNAAEQMLARAEPLPRMPASMQRNRLELVVPIVFSLRD